VPAFFDFPETRQLLWRERSIARVLELQNRMDLAVFSIGAVDGRVPSHVYNAGYLEAGDIAALRTEGVVGDIATVFFRTDGSYGGITINDRASGPTSTGCGRSRGGCASSRARRSSRGCGVRSRAA